MIGGTTAGFIFPNNLFFFKDKQCRNMSTPENKVELEEVVVLVAHWKPLEVFNGLVMTSAGATKGCNALGLDKH